MINESKIIKCGFNTYFDLDSGLLYEKKASEFLEIKGGLCDELERAFVSEKLAMEESVNKNTK